MPGPPLHVLVVDPEPAGAELLRGLLASDAGRDLTTAWAATFDGGLAALADQQADVCLVRHDPAAAMDGLAFLRHPEAIASGLPLILLTTDPSTEVEARARDLGGADCLPLDGLTPPLLERSLRLAVERRRRQRAEARLRAATRSAPDHDVAALKATEAALLERVKELRTLTLTGALLNRRDLRMRERLRRIVEVIPSGWQQPDRTEARLVLEGRTIATAGFRDTPWMISAQVPGQDPPGHLDVVFVPERPDAVEDPFLDEERELLVSLARTIGETVERERLTQLLSQTFRGLDDAVVVLDSIGHERRVRDMNPATERMFGFTREELVGDTPEKIHPHRSSFERFTAECRPVLERGGVFRGTFPLARKDGTSFQAEQTVSLLNPDQGIDGGVVTIVRDVSRQVEAEAALRASEERFRQIAEHVDSVFWISGADTERVEYVSPGYDRIWGRPSSELYDDAGSWSRSIVPEDRERVLQKLERKADGERFNEQYRIRRADGRIRWIQDRRSPVLDEDGQVVRVVGIAQDITDRKSAEERFGILSQEITDVIYVVAPDGTVTYSTSSIERATGYARSEFEGMDAFELVHPEDREDLRARLASIADSPGAVARAEYRVVGRDGAARHVESVARNLLDHAGVEGIVVTSRDVSDRVTLERQLRQGQKMEAIGRLAGGVAHDFNNILTVIRSQIELLLMDLAPGPTTEELLVIQSAAERATRLTSQLLAFSRDQILRPRKLGLGAAVRGLAEMMDRVLGEDLSIEYRLDEDTEPIEVDPDQLGQALLNLAVNARDAMPQGGVLSIATYVEDLGPEDLVALPGLVPDRYAVLRVSDTGTGMPEEVRNRIFDPFFTTKPRGKGTGLGLAMIYGFVKQSGGGVHVESRPGEGATFYLRFPVVEGEAPEPADTTGDIVDEVPPVRTEPDAAIAHKVLMVEDDPNVRKVARKVLERGGYDVRALGDAEEALALLRGPAPFDVLLTDLVLPGKSGRDLVDEVRGIRPELPLIVMSGYAEGSPGQRGDLPTEIGFLQKPFTRASILEAVRAAIAGA